LTFSLIKASCSNRFSDREEFGVAGVGVGTAIDGDTFTGRLDSRDWIVVVIGIFTEEVVVVIFVEALVSLSDNEDLGLIFGMDINTFGFDSTGDGTGEDVEEGTEGFFDNEVNIESTSEEFVGDEENGAAEDAVIALAAEDAVVVVVVVVDDDIADDLSFSGIVNNEESRG